MYQKFKKIRAKYNSLIFRRTKQIKEIYVFEKNLYQSYNQYNRKKEV